MSLAVHTLVLRFLHSMQAIVVFLRIKLRGEFVDGDEDGGRKVLAGEAANGRLRGSDIGDIM